ncbi:alpha/beta hydrolase [Thermodesulfobacteriota bacterium]
MTSLEQQEFVVEAEGGVKLVVRSRIPTKERLGKAVLLVHGSGVGWVYWDIPIRNYSIMDYLANQGLDVYAVECRGYGKSTKPNGLDVTARRMAEDAKFVIRSIKERSRVDKVSLAGHSSGGTVLLLAGGMYPELLDRMILIGTPYKKINPQFQEYARMVIDMAKEPGKDYVPNMHYQDIESRLDVYDEDVLAWYKRIVEEQYSLIPGGLFPDIVENPAVSYVSNMEIPVLIINGANEYVIESDDALAMFDDLGTTDKAIIIQPDGFHLMFIERRGHEGLQESIGFWVTKQ